MSFFCQHHNNMYCCKLVTIVDGKPKAPFSIANWPCISSYPCGGFAKYIYIYVWCYPQSDCFIVSQLFCVAWYARGFKLELKPGWLYVSWISYPKATMPLRVSEGIFCIYIHLDIHLSATRVLNSLEQLCIYAYMITSNSPLKCLTHRGELKKKRKCRCLKHKNQLFIPYTHLVYFYEYSLWEYFFKMRFWWFLCTIWCF